MNREQIEKWAREALRPMIEGTEWITAEHIARARALLDGGGK